MDVRDTIVQANGSWWKWNDATALDDKGFPPIPPLGGKLSPIFDFLPEWDAGFLDEIHRMLIFAAESDKNLRKRIETIKNIFQDSFTTVVSIHGNVRPGDRKGHKQ